MYRSNGKLFKAEGIILSRRNIGEADKIITVFTKEYGKIRLIAKGIRRIKSRRAPHLEPFIQCLLVIHKGQTLDSVIEVTPINIFEHIRRDLTKISIAYVYCELVSMLLAEKQEHQDIYVLLVRAFETQLPVREFTLELLWALGFLPRTKRLAGAKLQAFVESVTERRLRTPKLVRHLLQ